MDTRNYYRPEEKEDTRNYYRPEEKEEQTSALKRVSIDPAEPINKLEYNEIGIKSGLKGSEIKKYVDRAVYQLIYVGNENVTLKAIGNACSKVLSIADILRRKILGLHLIQKNYSRKYIAHYESDDKKIKRDKEFRLPCLDITLTFKLSENNPQGHIPPIAKEELDLHYIDPANPPYMIRGRGGRGGRGRGRGMGFRGFRGRGMGFRGRGFRGGYSRGGMREYPNRGRGGGFRPRSRFGFRGRNGFNSRDEFSDDDEQEFQVKRGFRGNGRFRRGNEYDNIGFRNEKPEYTNENYERRFDRFESNGSEEEFLGMGRNYNDFEGRNMNSSSGGYSGRGRGGWRPRGGYQRRGNY